MKVTAREFYTEAPTGDDPRAVLVTVVVYSDQRRALVEAYRPGQTPTLLADDARSVAEPIVAALVALETP